MIQISTDSKENLEFSKVLQEISLKCVSSAGKARLLNTIPANNFDKISELLSEVTEMKNIYVAEGGMPIWHFEDSRVLLRKIEPLSSYLEPSDCQEIQNGLEVVKEIYAFFSKHEGNFPLLTRQAEQFHLLENLRKKIENTIEPSGAIYDNASPELKRIRKEISAISSQIHVKLERILKKQSEHLQEEYVTLREGRLVVPVREFSVNKIPGIVHGQSASGQTHYVEPMSIVSLNNTISELYAQEKREIIAILQNLSAEIRSHGPELLTNLEILTHFDSLQARAQYSIAVNGTAPLLNSELIWDVKHAFHPLLFKKMGQNAVPLSIKIDQSLRTIIITGPNAGGKTVALKTIGLLQLMVQSGLHVPAAESSSFPICNQIFAVIGDEQSIEHDLSTFSSHIQQLNTIVNELQDKSLVLIDEIGSGTDPAEGSALAIAFLEELQSPATLSIVTTHHGALKAFAHRTEGVINAAMQFDRDSLTPLFKLETGIPGSSYAFDISRRLGLRQEILERAKEIMGSSQHQLEEIILELSKVKQEYEKRLKDISLKKSELEGLQSLYTQRSDDLKKKRKRYEQEAYESAQEILNGVNKELEKIVREIRESQASPEIIKHSKRSISRMRKNVRDALSSGQEDPVQDISVLSEGTWIKSKRFGVSGPISMINHNKMEVELEIKGTKICVPFDDITIISPDKQQKGTSSTGSDPAVPAASYEIDLRGKVADEALMDLENYLDQAILADWNEIRIIHGKGTGVLKQRIHEYLKRSRVVKSFRLGRYGEGDSGVTVVNLS